jgi:virulence-associated protein VagC
MAHHIGKVFMNGRSQAIRLPKEFRFEVDEVYMKKMGNELIITAVEPSWDIFSTSHLLSTMILWMIVMIHQRRSENRSDVHVGY